MDYQQVAESYSDRELSAATAGPALAMEQRPDMDELSFLLELMPCNISDPDSSLYNFSHSTAVDLIVEYRNTMLTISQPTTIALLCLYVPTFLLALGGNLLVIHVVVSNKHMRRGKNMFLVNLAIADIFVTLLCIPMVAGQTVYRLWVYGQFMCKLSGYMQGLAVTSSIFTLCALSVDRYLAIKCPMSLKRLSGKFKVMRVLFVIWLLSGIFACPLLFIRRVNTVGFNCLDIDFSYCIEKWPHEVDRKVYGILVMIIIYVLPLSVVAVCYGLIGRALCGDEFPRKTSGGSEATVLLGRKRVARMLIALIVVFVVCWLPYNACSLRLDLSPQYHESQILPFTLWLGHAHSAINPVLYWFLNKSFRHCMRKAVSCQANHASRRESPSPMSPQDIRLQVPAAVGRPAVPEAPVLTLRDRLQLRQTPHWIRPHLDQHKGQPQDRRSLTKPRIVITVPDSEKAPLQPKVEKLVDSQPQLNLSSQQTGSAKLSSSMSNGSTSQATSPTSPSTDNTQHGFCTSRTAQV